MAEPEKQDYRGVTSGLDMSKLPLYGQDDERLQELRDAQQKSIEALQKRYEQPNWWKVAAGFAKPQLGGFFASLGSASEAMGENLENQRAQQLPIEQMKLQMYQSNMLLAANKKVADEVKKWRDEHPGQTPPAQLVGHWEGLAPGSNVVKSLKDELTYQQTQENTNLQRIQHKIAANIPLTKDDEAVLAQKPEGMPRANAPKIEGAPTVTGEAEVTKPEAKPEAKAENKPKNIYVLPNEARVGEDVFKDLYKKGIPVISNIRTQEEQEALKDHQDEKGNWFTKEGRPVAQDSKHLTGDAIDLDTKAKLTDEQKKILADGGWKQTNPKNDPNHWERTPTESEEKPKATVASASKQQFYSHSVPKPNTAGMGSDDRRIISEAYVKNATAKEAPYQESLAKIQPIVTGNNYTRIKNSYDTAISMIDQNPVLAKKVFAMMRQDPVLAALGSGFGVHAGTFNANVSLPVQAFLDAGLTEKEKNYADKLFSSMMNITMASLQAQGVAMGKVPQQEYLKAMSGFVSPDQTALAASNILHHSRADFDQGKEYYDLMQKEHKNKVDPKSLTPYADIHNNSSDLQKLHRKYASVHKTYDDEYQKRLNAKQ
jgi:hypothetical protein